MPECRDAKLLQVFRRQVREDRFVNLVLAERSLIFTKAKAPQPHHDVHDDAPTPRSRASRSTREKSYYSSEGFSGILKKRIFEGAHARC